MESIQPRLLSPSSRPQGKQAKEFLMLATLFLVGHTVLVGWLMEKAGYKMSTNPKEALPIALGEVMLFIGYTIFSRWHV